MQDYSSTINALNQIEKPEHSLTKEITAKFPVFATTISTEIGKQVDKIIASKQTTPRNKTFEDLLTCYSATPFH